MEYFYKLTAIHPTAFKQWDVWRSFQKIYIMMLGAKAFDP